MASLPLTTNGPAIVDCALGAATGCLIAISDEVDTEDVDNDRGFWAGVHAAISEVPNTKPSKN